MAHAAAIATPFGRLGIGVAGGRITRIDWLPPGPEWPGEDPLAGEAAAQLRVWFNNPHHPFDLPLAAPDTPFRARMRAAMCAIPPGSTRSYGEIAADIGSAARAVGGACRHNPLAVIVPCHRVVARNGIGGYSGDWARAKALSHKQRLLAFERRHAGAGA